MHSFVYYIERLQFFVQSFLQERSIRISEHAGFLKNNCVRGAEK